MEKIKVLVVDDSASVRKMLTEILASDPEIQVIGTASDPFVAAKRIHKELPDVITLDLEMPKMDGLNFLKRIMAQHPIPVVIISGVTQRGTKKAVEALALGAVDVVQKPTAEELQDPEARLKMIDIVKGASKAVLMRKAQSLGVVGQPIDAAPVRRIMPMPGKIIAVGASTGGPEALLHFLQAMPANCPGIVIVQHMPEVFTRSFADRLDKICQIKIKEATDGDPIVQGQALIAPGNKHMEVRTDGNSHRVAVRYGPPCNRHRPSVDILFSSVARTVGANAIGIIMTGMGADGAKGLLEMKEQGAVTVAQDEKTSVVFGMPKEAIRIQAATKVLPLHTIASYVCSLGV